MEVWGPAPSKSPVTRKSNVTPEYAKQKAFSEKNPKTISGGNLWIY